MCVFESEWLPYNQHHNHIPWPSPSKDNKLAVNPERKENMVSSLSSQPLILVMAVTAHEAFMRASWHSIMNTNIVTRRRKKKRINKSHGLKKKKRKRNQTKQEQLMDGYCEALFSWLTTPVSKSAGVSPGGTVPVVVCCPVRCYFLQKHLWRYLPGKPQQPLIFIPGN